MPSRATPAPTGASVRHVVLVGMMGAGKTSIGRRVAKELGRRFVDADVALEKRTGRRIPEIFATDGEEAFRVIERDVIAELVTSQAPLVIATGGGAVLAADTREVLRRHGVVVWLRASPDTLLRRVRGGAGRPLLAEDPAGALARLCSARAEFYAAAAHVVIDVDRLTAVQCAAEVAQQVRRLTKDSLV